MAKRQRCIGENFISFLCFRGGKICLDIHFSPLWAKNVPKFGIAHALALAVKLFCDLIHNM
jgi:hypothetical protein